MKTSNILLAGLISISTLFNASAQTEFHGFDKADSVDIGWGWLEKSYVTSMYWSNTSPDVNRTNWKVRLGDLSGRLKNGQAWFYKEHSTINSVLENNTALVTWEFNMRQTDPSPNKLSMGGEGVAFILGKTFTTHAGNTIVDFKEGEGYAVVLGGGTSDRQVRLVHFTDGIDNPDVTSATTDILQTTNSYTTQHLTVKVTYNPSNNEWNLYVHSNGSFNAPEYTTYTAAESFGPAVNTTHTSKDLKYFGGYYTSRHSTNDFAEFDNITVSVNTPATSNIFDFNRPDNTTVGNGWNEQGWTNNTWISGLSPDVSLINNEVRVGDLSNRTANALGWFIREQTNISTILKNNANTISWEFNMRQTDATPNKLSLGGEGVGFVLANQYNNFRDGKGYAVVLGGGTSDRQVRLVHYKGGLDNSVVTNATTDILQSTNSYSTEYLTVKVTYNPTNDEWKLYVHENANAFEAPSTVAYSAAESFGPAVNSLYTSDDLKYFGGYYASRHSTGDYAQFDNLAVGFTEETEEPTDTTTTDTSVTPTPTTFTTEVFDFNQAANAHISGGWDEHSVAGSHGWGGSSPDVIATNNEVKLGDISSRTSNGLAWFTRTHSLLNPVLASNTNVVAWEFNMRQTDPTPNMLKLGGEGVAFVLGNTSTNFRDGSGYAVVLGGSPANRQVRLVHFTYGLDNSVVTDAATDILESSDLFTNEYLTVRVEFNPANSEWKLFVHSNTNSFDVPEAFTYAPSETFGPAVNNTHTALSLDNFGGYYASRHSTGDVAIFDNITVGIATNTAPPTTTTQSVIYNFNDVASPLLGHGWTEEGDNGATAYAGSSPDVILTNNEAKVGDLSNKTSNGLAWFHRPHDLIDPILVNNTTTISWEFNMRQTDATPNMLKIGGEGIAMVLGNTTTNFRDGSGYAVVLGGSPANRQVRLVHFNYGVDNSAVTDAATDILETSDLFTTEYLTVKVTYNPSNNEWNLFVHENVSSFDAPGSFSYTPAESFGPAVNSTYTGLSLDNFGGYYASRKETNDFAIFDNIVVTIEGNAPASQPTNIQNFVYINEIVPSSGFEIGGPVYSDLTCYDVEFYDATGNKTYNKQLAGNLTSGNNVNQMSAQSFNNYYLNYVPFTNNGDAIALIWNGTCGGQAHVAQFLSYNGAGATAVEGAATGLTPTNVGSGTNGSASLIGKGTKASDFTWSDIASTPSSPNTGQTQVHNVFINEWHFNDAVAQGFEIATFENTDLSCYKVLEYSMDNGNMVLQAEVPLSGSTGTVGCQSNRGLKWFMHSVADETKEQAIVIMYEGSTPSCGGGNQIIQVLGSGTNLNLSNGPAAGHAPALLQTGNNTYLTEHNAPNLDGFTMSLDGGYMTDGNYEDFVWKIEESSMGFMTEGQNLCNLQSSSRIGRKPVLEETIENEVTDLQVYPNPFSTTTTINASSVAKPYNLSVFNSNGTTVYNTESFDDEFTLNADFANGIYFIILNGADGSLNKVTVVKQ